MAGEGERARLGPWLESTRAWFDHALERHFPRGAPGVPALLDEAAHYAVGGSGKRLRPALVLLACEWVGGDARACELPAVAVELVHGYSLVHDDLPSMDDDDWRRGQPSCHRRFGEAIAILAGDALQARAFEVLAAGPADLAREWTSTLAKAAGAAGMVGGQVLDLDLASDGPVEATVRAIHALKTAALIAASAELGAIAGRADAARRALAREFGEALGFAFQAVDDVLDVTADRKSLGKTPGKDAKLRRATLVAALGVEGARAAARAHAERARVAAVRLGGPREALALEWIDFLLDRKS